ncbi:restriction endonuclease [Streptomyces sp. NPDC054932]
MASRESRSGVARRGATLGRDLVLAVGLVGTAVGGLAVFVKAASAAGTRMPVLPMATAVVLLIGVAFARWSVSPVGRRSSAASDPGGRSATGVRSAMGVRPATDPPDVGADALDHGAADADGFEHTVAALCVRDGCTPVEVVGGAGDLGADVIATTPDGLRVIVQCKHYAEDNRVGSQDLQRFGGTCFAVHDADVAIVVTTGHFTAPALEYAATCGIVCVDGEALAAWTEPGVRPPPWEPDAVHSDLSRSEPTVPHTGAWRGWQLPGTGQHPVPGTPSKSTSRPEPPVRAPRRFDQLEREAEQDGGTGYGGRRTNPTCWTFGAGVGYWRTGCSKWS